VIQTSVNYTRHFVRRHPNCRFAINLKRKTAKMVCQQSLKDFGLQSCRQDNKAFRHSDRQCHCNLLIEAAFRCGFVVNITRVLEAYRRFLTDVADSLFSQEGVNWLQVENQTLV
jgi:hypothetical protein